MWTLLTLRKFGTHFKPDADAQQRVRAIIDRLQVAVLALDEQGRYVAASPGASSLTGYSHGELLTMSIVDSPLEVDFSVHERWQRVSGDRTSNRTATVRDGSGRRHEGSNRIFDDLSGAACGGDCTGTRRLVARPDLNPLHGAAQQVDEARHQTSWSPSAAVVGNPREVDLTTLLGVRSREDIQETHGLSVMEALRSRAVRDVAFLLESRPGNRNGRRRPPLGVRRISRISRAPSAPTSRFDTYRSAPASPCRPAASSSCRPTRTTKAEVGVAVATEYSSSVGEVERLAGGDIDHFHLQLAHLVIQMEDDERQIVALPA